MMGSEIYLDKLDPLKISPIFIEQRAIPATHYWLCDSTVFESCSFSLSIAISYILTASGLLPYVSIWIASLLQMNGSYSGAIFLANDNALT